MNCSADDLKLGDISSLLEMYKDLYRENEQLKEKIKEKSSERDIYY